MKLMGAGACAAYGSWELVQLMGAGSSCSLWELGADHKC